MRFISLLATVLLAVTNGRAQGSGKPKRVFAHFMVGNTANFTIDDWDIQIGKAVDSGVYGFALNMAYDWPHNEDTLELAFQSASTHGLILIFSFDYAGNGPWDKDVVISYLQKYGSHSQYWKHSGKPLVSTFEGPGNADDWIEIKARTNCFFMPDWSSAGAGPALALAGGVADGLFSWAAWPWGNREMDTFVDASYLQALNGKPYMMPVSPWFYTNLPGYYKNWLWSSGHLWYTRWQQVWDLQPDYVQIISWNDFGESHYIGGLDPKQYEAFETGKAPFNYVDGMAHEGWRVQLPFMIDTYVDGKATFTKESATVAHHRTSLLTGCSDGGTTLNTANQLQLEHQPASGSPDKVYVAALLTAPASISFSSGGKQQSVGLDEWDVMPDGGVGLYLTTLDITTEGYQSLSINRNGIQLQFFRTLAEDRCPNTLTNWNAYVEGATWDYRLSGEYTPELSLSEQVCIKGWSVPEFNKVCEFTCSYGYCPLGACVCSQKGKQRKLPESKNVNGYPANGDANYAGLCSFSCNYGYCPPEWCSLTKQPDYIPTSSPFNPPSYTGGKALISGVEGLCSYACNFGFCPIAICSCTSTGPLILPPAETDPYVALEDFDGLDLATQGICYFACVRGYCPDPCLSKVMARDGPTLEDIEEARIAYHGIWWKTAGKTCSVERFKTLVDTVGDALWLAKATVNMLEVEAPESEAWDLYMGLASVWEVDLMKFSIIREYYQKAITWITTANGKEKRQYKIAYYCGDPDQYTRCKEAEQKRKVVLAYTLIDVGSGSFYENCPRNCWGVGFCEPFWKQESIQGQFRGSPILESELSNQWLASKEHTMLHEWMHNDIIGTTYHVSDQSYVLDGITKPAYGGIFSQEFAELESPSINVNTAVNADSFAWVQSYTAYSATFGWRISKRALSGWGSLLPWKHRRARRSILDMFSRDFVTENKEMIEIAKGTAGQFASIGGCTLTLDCRYMDEEGRVGNGCTCTCDGQQVVLDDTRCVWLWGTHGVTIQPGAYFNFTDFRLSRRNDDRQGVEAFVY